MQITIGIKDHPSGKFVLVTRIALTTTGRVLTERIVLLKSFALKVLDAKITTGVAGPLW